MSKIDKISTEALVAALRRASVKHSFRKIARETSLSHEIIRRFVLGSHENISVNTYNTLTEWVEKNAN